MLQDLNQSNKRDEILFLAGSQHKHLLQYGLPLLSSWCWSLLEIKNWNRWIV